MHLLLKVCLACSVVVGCSARPPGDPPPPDCFLVFCMPLDCIDQYTPPDQCCPVCRSRPVSGCVVNGVRYREGDTVKECTGPCQTCMCRNGSVHFSIISCRACDTPFATLETDTPPALQQGGTQPGQCCPTCDDSVHVIGK